MKKFITLLVTVSMIMALCVPAGAASADLTEEVYILQGTEYTLPDTVSGKAVVWDAENTIARRVVSGTTLDGEKTELIVNVGMYAPTVLDNFEDEALGSLTSHVDVLNGWASQRKANLAKVHTFEQESTGNKYLKISNVFVPDFDITGKYGAYYTLAENELSGNISIEAKVKIPQEAQDHEVGK